MSQGIKKGDCIAIFMENRPELIACILACAKIGAVSAMLNIAQKGKVLAHSINISKPKMIIAGEESYLAYEDKIFAMVTRVMLAAFNSTCFYPIRIP